MVIVKLVGGLGNQMFQYAVARQLAHLRRTPLKLDISSFEADPLRTYRLKHFNISGELAAPGDLPRAKQLNLLGKATRLVERFRPYYRRSWIIEQRRYHFDPNIFQASAAKVYLEGYWQSEKYFRDIAGIIRTEFTLKNGPDAVNTKIAEQICATDSVSLHVRRGDYVSDPGIHRLFGTCSLEYYHTAIEKIVAGIREPHFFVFSDDPDWVQENLKTEFPMIYVTHNGPERDYEDLRLMSLCQHHIIANSSFSWWGAWLNSNPDKTVLAPRQWFNLPREATDLLPEPWIQL